MNANHHPCHYAQVLTAETDAEFKLLDCRANDLPPSIKGVPVFFTSPWKAMRFLNTEAITVTELTRIGGNKAFIDPCGACGFAREVSVSKGLAGLDKEVLYTRAQRDIYIGDAKLLMQREDFENAYLTLQTTVNHFDCGHDEIHFLIGLCAIKLKDEIIFTEALNNLKLLSSQYTSKLENQFRL